MSLSGRIVWMVGLTSFANFRNSSTACCLSRSAIVSAYSDSPFLLAEKISLRLSRLGE